MRPRRAVVLGGGLAGMLSAAALAESVDEVTVVERDRLPEGPQERRGTPQARHFHALMCGGAAAIEDLVPGTLKRLRAEGAHRVGMPSQFVSFSPQGWFRRFDCNLFLVACSRPLLDFVVRDQVLSSWPIRMLDGREAVGLRGDARRVTAVEVRDVAGGGSQVLGADLVVDAMGRGSRTDRWLVELGLPVVREEVVDSGLQYATRLFQAPPGACEGFPVVTVQASPHGVSPGQAGGVIPIERGRWLVTLSGTRGAAAPTREEDFKAFARNLRHPVVGELLTYATPLGPVMTTRSTTNRRRRYERVRPWPEGLAVMGDALAAFNPVYGHGMSVAAQTAVALRESVRRGVSGPRLQRVLARVTDGAWRMATTEDLQYASDQPQNLATRLRRRYVERTIRTATSRPEVAKAFFGAFTLAAPFRRLLSPRVVLGVLRGPGEPPLLGPPLTSAEWSAVTSKDTPG
ncbi:FAD-dependent oxidoreductase [Longimycelium tulufanense]|uniref:FAD-dependent oxidoreductase n=1 Tax=Longimycelium tulufanense TaxID=907463 RepID=UPI001E51C5CA|nr:FAD-dependent monooxygenase [Longimycelium tulufanense]